MSAKVHIIIAIGHIVKAEASIVKAKGKYTGAGRRSVKDCVRYIIAKAIIIVAIGIFVISRNNYDMSFGCFCLIINI